LPSGTSTEIISVNDGAVEMAAPVFKIILLSLRLIENFS